MPAVLRLEDIVHRADEFRSWNYADRVRLFCWYVGKFRKEPFLTSDIEACFDELRVKKPSAVGPFLRAMANRHPAELVETKAGFNLERQFLADYDRQFEVTPSRIAINHDLQELKSKLRDSVERDYLNETIVCFSHGAFRASILMAWNLAFFHLVNWVSLNHLHDFSTQLDKSYPKLGITLRNVDDFTYLKEDQIIATARAARIVSSGTHKVLKEKLDRRNALAHPSRMIVRNVTAEEYIRDLVENVILPLA